LTRRVRRRLQHAAPGETCEADASGPLIP